MNWILGALAALHAACGGGSGGGDPSVCSAPVDASVCPSGSAPLPRSESDCLSEVAAPCGQAYAALIACENASPTCVTSNGTAVANAGSCDAEEAAWDDCVMTHGS